jgi:transcriptional regulator with XRE-family HTH domain
MRLNFGSILQACRTRAGISQERLAELLNKSRSCISKYEQGHKLPDIQTFLAWLDRTNAKDVGYACVSGMDSSSILQSILQVAGVA